MIEHTGHDDTRFLVRGRVDWEYVNKQISKSSGIENEVFFGIKKMLEIRNNLKLFGKANIEWIEAETGLLVYTRTNKKNKVLIVNNLTDTSKILNFNSLKNLKCLFSNELYENIMSLNIAANNYKWLLFV